MSEFVLEPVEVSSINTMLNRNNMESKSFKKYLSESGCNRYDCFVRGVQCPCEGICDGKA